MTQIEVLTQAFENKLALELTRALSESVSALPPTTLNRLRTAREAALRVQKPELDLAKPLLTSGQTAFLSGGDGDRTRWLRWALWLPMLVLISGIYLIEVAHQESQISAAADVDAELLVDDLPLNAYTDAGFLEFLQLERP